VNVFVCVVKDHGSLKGVKLKLNNNKVNNLLNIFFTVEILITDCLKFILKPYEYGDVILISKLKNNSLKRTEW
jgi:hypothetical protein